MVMNVANAEGTLKSYCKSKGYQKPVYKIVSRNSQLLNGEVFRFKHYVFSVTVNRLQLATGDGFSKRIARKKAAMLGLQNIRLLEFQNRLSGELSSIASSLAKINHARREACE